MQVPQVQFVSYRLDYIPLKYLLNWAQLFVHFLFELGSQQIFINPVEL